MRPGPGRGRRSRPGGGKTAGRGRAHGARRDPDHPRRGPLHRRGRGPRPPGLPAVTPAGLLVDLTVLLVAAVATAAVRTPDPVRQAVVLSQLGLLLALLFTFLQAPDVALSQLAVGTVVTPLLILLTVRKIRRQGGTDEGAGRRGRGGDR
ncbi:DUF4040 domain-containing protein [Streptomyces polychromogenes]|nr:DUF4040 domain-containing protein [Streptomyces polychromogenes]